MGPKKTHNDFRQKDDEIQQLLQSFWKTKLKKNIKDSAGNTEETNGKIFRKF